LQRRQEPQGRQRVVVKMEGPLDQRRMLLLELAQGCMQGLLVGLLGGSLVFWCFRLYVGVSGSRNLGKNLNNTYLTGGETPVMAAARNGNTPEVSARRRGDDYMFEGRATTYRRYELPSTGGWKDDIKIGRARSQGSFPFPTWRAFWHPQSQFPSPFSMPFSCPEGRSMTHCKLSAALSQGMAKLKSCYSRVAAVDQVHVSHFLSIILQTSLFAPLIAA